MDGSGNYWERLGCIHLRRKSACLKGVLWYMVDDTLTGITDTRISGHNRPGHNTETLGVRHDDKKDSTGPTGRGSFPLRSELIRNIHCFLAIGALRPVATVVEMKLRKRRVHNDAEALPQHATGIKPLLREDLPSGDSCQNKSSGFSSTVPP